MPIHDASQTRADQAMKTLGPQCLETLEAAVGLAKRLTHSEVHVEHWLHAMLTHASGDVPRILHALDIPADRVQTSLTETLEAMRAGSSRAPHFSPRYLVPAMSYAHGVAVWDMGKDQIRTGHILLAGLEDDRLRAALHAACPEILQIDPADLRDRFDELTAGSIESDAQGSVDSGPRTDAPRTAGASQEELERYTVDLTALAYQPSAG